MSSYQKPRLTRVVTAASDLSAKQYHYIKDDGTGSATANGGGVIAGGATGEIGIGFLQNTPEINEACETMGIGGGAKGVAAGTITVQQELKADANGQMVVATTAGDIVSAIAREDAVSGDIFEIEPVLYRKHA